jgi:DNA-binding IclR family transcriptional regulator
MPCVNADGTLVSSAKKILEAARTPGTPTELAERSRFPLYRVHSALRELADAGMVLEVDGRYQVTEVGLDRLAAKR